MRYAVIAAILFIIGFGLTLIERPGVRFTPIVRVRTGNGLYMTFLQNSLEKRHLCLIAVEKLAQELYNTCPSCSVESSGCPDQVQGIESTLANNRPVPLYVVSTDEIRIGILGPPASVRARCEQMASVMLQGGLKSAVCIPPAAPS
jgi:hypothetical protein